MNLQTLFECPYCPRDGSGVIAVDFHRLASIGTPESPLNDEMDETPGEASGVLVFNPDGASNRPCRHLVSFLLDLEVNTSSDDQIFCHEISWDHPWFGDNDPIQSVEIFLWTDVNGGDRRGFYPITPFKIRQVCAENTDSREGNELSVSGTVIVTLGPDSFFTELATGYNRFQSVENT